MLVKEGRGRNALLASLNRWVLREVQKNFLKVLDGDAKADQNLASLLLTTNAMRM